MTSLPIRARAWAATINGQRIDTGLPSTPECVDLARHWAMQLGAPEIAYGHGKDFAHNLAKQSGWTFINPDQPARPGDIASWDWDDFGHVAVVQSDQGGTLTVTQQNPLPAHTKAGVTKSGLIGYARPTMPMPDTSKVTIRKGDTLWGLSRRLGLTVDAIKAANPGVDPDNLPIDGTLDVPSATRPTYVVPGAFTLARQSPAGEVIGSLPQGTIVVPTGKTDGVWVQGASPWQASRGSSAWYHQDFLREAA